MAERGKKKQSKKICEDHGELKKYKKTKVSGCVRREPRCDGISPVGVAKCHGCFPAERRESASGGERGGGGQKKRGNLDLHLVFRCLENETTGPTSDISLTSVALSCQETMAPRTSAGLRPATF